MKGLGLCTGKRKKKKKILDKEVRRGVVLVFATSLFQGVRTPVDLHMKKSRQRTGAESSVVQANGPADQGNRHDDPPVLRLPSDWPSTEHEMTRR